MSKGGSQARIFFELPAGSPVGAESLWATEVSDGKYRLDNSPLYVYGFSLGDVVTAIEQEGVSVVQGICVRGGHSTYRVSLAEGLGIKSPEFLTYWNRLVSLGCTYEGAGSKLLAIDVPPSSDVFLAYSILEEGEKDGVWEFEEGHCGHTLSKNSQSGGIS